MMLICFVFIVICNIYVCLCHICLCKYDQRHFLCRLPKILKLFETIFDHVITNVYTSEEIIVRFNLIIVINIGKTGYKLS